MADSHNQKNRQSIRLPEYDYSQPGAYFVTMVTCERECLFGKIIAGRMVLSPQGRIAEEQRLRPC
jgi:putative transposase